MEIQIKHNFLLITNIFIFITGRFFLIKHINKLKFIFIKS